LASEIFLLASFTPPNSLQLEAIFSVLH
jgi:hypothetical protein